MNALSERSNAELVWTPTNDAWPFDTWLNPLWDGAFVSLTPGSVLRVADGGRNHYRSAVFDRGDAFEVVVELPGIPKERIDVTVQGTRLRIHADDGTAPTEASPTATPASYRYPSFQREFELPEPVAASTIQARAENGVLTVRVPKPKAAPEEKVPLA